MPLPSVLLHDHLDGGLRPETVLELAEVQGYDSLPFFELESLADWFDQSECGSLEAYLLPFEHTVALMQTPDAVERVAYESLVDAAGDGVVHAEIRFCPLLNTRLGMSVRSVLEAVTAGLNSAATETGSSWALIICALRHVDDSLDVVRHALDARDLGVVAFDIAGPEAGFPPHQHLAAFRLAREQGLRITIHAGESAGNHGVANVASAMDRCGADRIGHGVELVDDCVLEDGEIVKLGAVASRVRERRLPLELCPTSNLATNRLQPEEHPVGALHRAGFTVTLNTDNRLMSSTTMSKEFQFAKDHHGFTTTDLAVVTRNALDAAFCDWETKARLWEDVIAPPFLEAGANIEKDWR